VRVDEYLRVRTGPDTEDVYAIGGAVEQLSYSQA